MTTVAQRGWYLRSCPELLRSTHFRRALGGPVVPVDSLRDHIEVAPAVELPTYEDWAEGATTRILQIFCKPDSSFDPAVVAQQLNLSAADPFLQLIQQLRREAEALSETLDADWWRDHTCQYLPFSDSMQPLHAIIRSELLCDRFDELQRAGALGDRIRHACAAVAAYRAGQDDRSTAVDAVGFRIERHLEPEEPLAHQVLRVPVQQDRAEIEPLLVGQRADGTYAFLAEPQYTPFLLMEHRKLAIRGNTEHADASRMVYTLEQPRGASEAALQRTYRAQLADRGQQISGLRATATELTRRVTGDETPILSIGQIPVPYVPPAAPSLPFTIPSYAPVPGVSSSAFGSMQTPWFGSHFSMQQSAAVHIPAVPMPSMPYGAAPIHSGLQPSMPFFTGTNPGPSHAELMAENIRLQQENSSLKASSAPPAPQAGASAAAATASASQPAYTLPSTSQQATHPPRSAGPEGGGKRQKVFLTSPEQVQLPPADMANLKPWQKRKLSEAANILSSARAVPTSQAAQTTYIPPADPEPVPPQPQGLPRPAAGRGGCQGEGRGSGGRGHGRGPKRGRSN